MRIGDWSSDVCSSDLSFGNLSADDYTLTADAALTSRNGQRLGVHYSTDFSAFDDISMLVDVLFTNTRLDRLTGTVSYDVTITNKTDGPITLPALLTTDPPAGFPGVPHAAPGQSRQRRGGSAP